MTLILKDIGLIAGLCLLEIWFNSQQAKAVDEDGERTKKEDKIIHEKFLPIRGALVLLGTLVLYQESFLAFLLLLLTNVALYGAIFNPMIAKIWLKREFFYVRGGDLKKGAVGFIVKSTLAIIGFLSLVKFGII